MSYCEELNQARRKLFDGLGESTKQPIVMQVRVKQSENGPNFPQTLEVKDAALQWLESENVDRIHILHVKSIMEITKKKKRESVKQTTLDSFLLHEYCQLMKLWFSMKITKEEFDLEARKLMTMEQTRLHNEFLLSLFSKCKGLALDSSKSRLKDSKKLKLGKQKKTSDKGSFQLADPVNYLPQLESPPQHLQDEPHRSCMQELFLPDHSLVLGRLMVASWEMGMEGADDCAAELLVHAVQLFLKNILTAVLAQRNGYRLREKRMIYSLGSPVPNPWLRNSEGINNEKSESKNTEVLEGEDDYVHVPKIPLTQEELERREMYRLACANSAFDPPSKSPVSTYDIFQALQVHKSVIPSHSLYAINMDKIISALSHPSHEEIETVRYLKKSKFLGREEGMRFTSKFSS